MRFVKMLVDLTAYIFLVLMVIMSVLFGTGLFDPLPFGTVTPILLLMSVGPGLVITIREFLMPEDSLPKSLIGVAGCTLIVYFTGLITKWFKFQWEYILDVCIITLVVYVMVWLLTYFQNSKDASELNDSLKNVQKDIED